MLKKNLFLCLAVCGLCVLACNAAFMRADAQSFGEIAMDVETGYVFEENNADLKLPMASTTKIMTAIIIIEDCDLDEVITAPDGAVGAEGSSIYLKHGEEIDIKDLLYGLMMRSGNDSAAALAIHHSGSLEKFAEVMNVRAKRIGAENTNFRNPSGLPDDEHYTTARDLCKIACYAMKNDVFKQIVSCKSYKGKYRAYTNKNKMLFSYEGANGVKTGYTVKAGRCLVSSAEREGMDVVCVVLNCPEMYERSKQILDGCFSCYRLVKLDQNAVFISDRVLCKTSKQLNFIAKKGETLDFKVKSLGLTKNIKSGDLVAELQICGQNGLILTENLYSINDR